MALMNTSLREQPKYAARAVSRLSTLIGPCALAAPASMAKIAAPRLSATNKIPSGPKARGQPT